MATTTTTTTTKTIYTIPINLTELSGNLFTDGIQDGDVLIHACNTSGTWGGGIALAFAARYPAAAKLYTAHCDAHTPGELAGTTFLIPPQVKDLPNRHYIGCLFTTFNWFKKKDTPAEIVDYTKSSMLDLAAQLGTINRDPGAVPVGALRMCVINSGIFRVPWPTTRTALQFLEVNGRGWRNRPPHQSFLEVEVWQDESFAKKPTKKKA